MLKQLLELNRITRPTSNLTMAKGHGLEKLFNILIVIYLIISIGVLILASFDYHEIGFLTLVLTQSTIQIIFEKAVFNKTIYKNSDYNNRLGFFESRMKYRYFRFRNEYKKSKILKKTHIKKLVKWYEIDNQQYPTKFHTSFLYISITGGAITVLYTVTIPYLKDSNSIALFTLVIFMVLGFIKFLHATATLNFRKKFFILKFLKWLEIELEQKNKN